MFNPEEIARIRTRLQSGDTPDQIGQEEFGIQLSTFRARLLNSGYRIVTTRDLEEIRPVVALPCPEEQEIADLVPIAA